MSRTTSTFPAILGAVIASLRDSREWTQAELASRAGTSQGVLSRIEAGQMQPTAQLYSALARAFGLSLTNLEARVVAAQGVVQARREGSARRGLRDDASAYVRGAPCATEAVAAVKSPPPTGPVTTNVPGKRNYVLENDEKLTVVVHLADPVDPLVDHARVKHNVPRGTATFSAVKAHGGTGMTSLRTDEEGISWIRGWAALDGQEANALRAANALKSNKW